MTNAQTKTTADLRIEKSGSLWKVRDSKNAVHAVAETKADAARLRDRMLNA